MLYRKMYLWLVVLVALSTTYAAKTEVDITDVSVFYSDENADYRLRNRGDQGNLIDNDEGTWSYTTAGFTDQKTIVAFDLGGSNMINQLKVLKQSSNIDAYGNDPDYPNMEILVSTDTGELMTRRYYRVTNLVSGDLGTQLVTATSVNVDGTITGEHGGYGWYAVTFNPATVTAVAFSVERGADADAIYVHYPVNEVEAYYETEALPKQASDPAPANGAIDVSVSTGLSWLPGTNTVSQAVSFGTDPNFLAEVATGDDSLVSVSNAEIETALGGSLELYVKYYWRVGSVNTDANEFDGELWSFTTEPPIVQNPTPADGVRGVSASEVTLQWQGFSTVTSYDVYLGTDPEDLVLQDNVTLQELTLSSLMESTDYFWQVEALDAGDNPITISDVWSFRTAGLTHHWAMDDEIGSSVMADWISGADGVIPVSDANIVFVDDAERGRVIEFESNAHAGVPCGDTAPMSGDVTLSAWAKRSSIAGMNIFSFGGGYQLGFEMGIDSGTGLVYDTLDMYIGGIWWVPGATALGNSWPITDGSLVPSGIDTWHMFTVTSVDGTTSVYKDGELQTSLSESGWNHPVDLVIGQNNPDGAWGYVGRLDDIRIYDKGLSSIEVADLYLQETHTGATSVCAIQDPLDLDGSCYIDLGDIVIYATKWLECGRYPASECVN